MVTLNSITWAILVTFMAIGIVSTATNLDDAQAATILESIKGSPVESGFWFLVYGFTINGLTPAYKIDLPFSLPYFPENTLYFPYFDSLEVGLLLFVIFLANKITHAFRETFSGVKGFFYKLLMFTGVAMFFWLSYKIFLISLLVVSGTQLGLTAAQSIEAWVAAVRVIPEGGALPLLLITLISAIGVFKLTFPKLFGSKN